MKKARLGIIGGTGVTDPLENGTTIRVGTPYGPSPPITVGVVGGKGVAFLPRHGEKHAQPPHRLNYRANLWALHALGVERVFATNAVGAINLKYRPGDLVVPGDFIDFTRNRVQTFYDEAPVTHIDVSAPYCPELRVLVTQAAAGRGARVWGDAVYLCTEGPRYETPAEIRMFRGLGGDVVGMTGLPEVVLARELEMCYVALCFVTNMAAGLQARLSADLIIEDSRRLQTTLDAVVTDAIHAVPWTRSCECVRTLEGTRV
jgi:5'-methylthioadenosine phosphorylase